MVNELLSVSRDHAVDGLAAWVDRRHDTILQWSLEMRHVDERDSRESTRAGKLAVQSYFLCIEPSLER